jgi:hypothetical protein
MKRLVEVSAEADATLRTVVGLLERVPPVADSAAAKRRVRARISARAARKPSLNVGRLALVLVLLVAGVAGARGMDRGRWSRARDSVTSWLTKHEAPARAPSANIPGLKRPSAPSPDVVDSEAPTLVEAPREHEPVPMRSSHVRLGSPSAKRVASLSASGASPLPPPSDPGSELMVAAMRARSAGDLATAERLLSDYRRRFPAGALSEEALALSVETAALRGSQLAPELARAYLARFPGGRYRTWVERTLVAPR